MPGNAFPTGDINRLVKKNETGKMERSHNLQQCASFNEKALTAMQTLTVLTSMPKHTGAMGLRMRPGSSPRQGNQLWDDLLRLDHPHHRESKRVGNSHRQDLARLTHVAIPDYNPITSRTTGHLP